MSVDDRAYVIPSRGLRVRNPELGSAVLPPEGDYVQWSPYWRRRESVGDVRKGAPPAPPDPEVAPSEAAAEVEAAPARPTAGKNGRQRRSAGGA